MDDPDGRRRPRDDLRHKPVGADRHDGPTVADSRSFLALLSAVVSRIGVAVTGSDTSSNSCFGGPQITAATQTALNEHLLVATNISGGVFCKLIIPPQNLTIAAAGTEGNGSEVARRVIRRSLDFVLVLCLLVFVESTAALDSMVVPR